MFLAYQNVAVEYLDLNKKYLQCSEGCGILLDVDLVGEIRVKLGNDVDFILLERLLFFLRTTYPKVCISLFSNGNKLNYNTVASLGRHINKFYLVLFSPNLKSNRDMCGAMLDKPIIKSAIARLSCFYSVDCAVVFYKDPTSTFDYSDINSACDFCISIDVDKICVICNLDDFSETSIFNFKTIIKNESRSRVGELRGIKVALRFFGGLHRKLDKAFV